MKDRPAVALVDLPAFGRPAVLVWRKRRWRCPEPACEVGTWTESDSRIAPVRAAMTDRAGRWVTVQVGREGRTVAEVARELGCDWHTVMGAVAANGTPLVEDPDRIGPVSALGLDETLFGATILGRGGAPNRAASALSDLYNAKGVFNNRADDLEGLSDGLRRRFANVAIAQEGCVAIFRAS